MSDRRRIRRGGGWLANLLMLTLSFAGALGVAEAAFRAMGNRPLYEIYSKPSLLWRYDASLGWSHEPGARDVYVGPRPWPVEFSSEIEINSQGLRGPEVAPPSPGELRLLFLGDSMVAGFEVPADRTFAAHLGELLSENLSRPVVAINAGVRGYGTDQSYLYYQERGRLLAPDLVVFFHSGNDPVDNMTLHEMRRPFGKPALRPSPSGELELVGSPVPQYPLCSEYVLTPSYDLVRVDGLAGRVLCNLQMALFDKSALFSVVTVALPWNSSLLRWLYYIGNPHADQQLAYGQRAPGEDPGRALTMVILRALVGSVRESGADLVVIGHPPDLTQLDLDWLATEAVPVIPLHSVAASVDSGVRWKHDSHYTEKGHRLAAEELAGPLAEWLRASGIPRRPDE